MKILSKSCEFGDGINSLVRDRIVFGINDLKLQEKLIKQGNVNLEDAITACRIGEQTKKQTEEIQKSVSLDINSMSYNSNSKNKHVNSQKHQTPQNASSSDNFSNRNVIINCTRCNSKHKMRECPAFGQRCKKCKLMNHFASCCRTKKINEIEISKESDGDELCINMLKLINKNVNGLQSKNFNISSIKNNTIINSSNNKCWFENLEIAKSYISFKLDTGSDVNVIPLKIYSKLNIKNNKLSDCNMTLKAYGGSEIKPLGIKHLEVKFGDNVSSELFVIVDNDTTPILGLAACVHFGLINRVHTISKDDRVGFINNNGDVFDGLGKFPDMVDIVLKSNVDPVSRPPRRIPLAIKPKVKTALENLTRLQIIEPTTEPSDWISNLVVVEKPNGSLRLCLDPKFLNQAIKKDYFSIPTLNDLKSKLFGAQYFTVLDLKDGFYQIQLTEESSKLCSFSTPFGTYKFKRLPFGINIAPEKFQKLNEKSFGDLEGTEIYIDDILVWGKNLEEHDRNLEKVIERARKLNVKFNKDKLQYRVQEVRFLGHIFSKDGIRSDPKRVEAINLMPDPKSKKDLQRYLGMINYMRSFIPNLAQKTEVLRQLLKNDVEFTWNACHINATQQLKQIITNTPVLAVFDENVKIVIQTDASKSGIGCVLLQNGKPVEFASRSLNPAEQNYAQIEKELLAIVYSCVKFHNYIYGRDVEIHTDHKPLVSIMKNEMGKINSSRLQRMKMKLLIYNTNVLYVPGKELHIADQLSRAYLQNEMSTEFSEYEEVIHSINMSSEKELIFQQESLKDEIISNIMKVYQNGWPSEKKKLPCNIKQYWKFKTNIYVDNGLVFLGERIMVPKSLRQDMLKMLHESHIGITKTQMRARQILYWPGIDTDIENFIASCRICEKFRPSNSREPMIPHPVPNYPFEYIGCDIMTYANVDYLVVIDYFSKWFEVVPIKTKQSKEQIEILKQIFSTHGIPKKMVADNQPFSSREFKNFATNWSFEIINTSPVYPQSNGQSEKAVHIAKMLVKKSIECKSDLSYVLLEYRNHPVSRLQSSPSQILMSRRTRTKLPIKDELLEPAVEKNVKQQLLNAQNKVKEYYDKTVKIRPDFSPGDLVTYEYRNEWRPAQIVRQHSCPRSYVIKNQNNQYLRRNKFHLRKSFNVGNNKPSEMYNQGTQSSTQASIGSSQILSSALDVDADNQSMNSSHSTSSNETQDFSEANNTVSAILPDSGSDYEEYHSFSESLSDQNSSNNERSSIERLGISTSESNNNEMSLNTSANNDQEDTENRVAHTRSGRFIKTPYALKDYDLN